MRAVVKVGSSSLHDGIGPRVEVFRNIADEVAELNSRGSEIAIVSSGAIAFGRAALKRSGVTAGSASINEKQMMASVGQLELMSSWQEAFAPHAHQVGQLLVTNQELFGKRPDERRNISGLIDTMLRNGVVPIVNENDGVAVDEIVLGDNDRLSAHLASVIGADTLVLLGQEAAFYTNYGTEDQRRAHLVVASDIETYRQHALCPQDNIGTGGMATKLAAAEIFLAEPSRYAYIAFADGPYPISRAIHENEGTVLES